jgi:hypothetical protein
MSRTPSCALTLLLFSLMASDGWSGELGGAGPLHRLSLEELESLLPSGTHLMVHAAVIERFLAELDGQPPDWATLYGQGHHDPAHDDRLFAFNRERDARRQGHSALSRQLAFSWTGELSGYDAVMEGFPVALGPKLIRTGWGTVRFKPEESPGNLCMTTEPWHRDQLQRQIDEGQRVEIDVVMTGRLVPDESIVYDFSHDEEGLGLVMPFVRVERVDFVMMTR